MDYGFVRDTTTVKDDTISLSASNDGFNCYLLIVDEYSHHLWIFLFATKFPPIKTVATFLNHHGNKTGINRVQTNQGGELAKSTAFCQCTLDAGYTLETTIARASF